MGVDASAVYARVGCALVNVALAVGAAEAGSAGALVRVDQRRTAGSVAARRQGAVVHRLAVGAAVTVHACATVHVQRLQ